MLELEFPLSSNIVLWFLQISKKILSAEKYTLWEHWTVDIFILQLLYSVILMQFDALSYEGFYLIFNIAKETK